MKNEIFKVKSNKRLTADVYQMVLIGDTMGITNCGQFVNILIDGLYLRRPISVCDYDEKSLTLVYKVVGKGTTKMSQMQKGEKLDILVGLGNGYDISRSGNNPLLIGGGVGVPPLYNLAKKLIIGIVIKINILLRVTFRLDIDISVFFAYQTMVNVKLVIVNQLRSARARQINVYYNKSREIRSTCLRFTLM